MSATVSIAGKTVRVDYGAPSMRGRKIMGSLVPYGVVWCAGANDATSLVTDADLEIAGLKVPKGSYTLWTIPGKTEWTLIVNRQTGQWHTEYNEDRDLGRVKINVKTLPSPVERFRIQLAATGTNKGTLSLIWETTDAWTLFTVLR
ncbi:MAG: DUF2911 domain-containing protein [Acidobacteriia bacterium]|nr:DUF2911 domain-containing protein [Terriglobia bacterium]